MAVSTEGDAKFLEEIRSVPKAYRFLGAADNILIL